MALAIPDKAFTDKNRLSHLIIPSLSKAHIKLLNGNKHGSKVLAFIFIIGITCRNI